MTKLVTAEDHDKQFMEILDIVKKMFNGSQRDGSLTPMFHVVNSKGEHILVALALDFDVAGKDKCEEMMMLFALGGAQCICFFSEAWMVKGQEKRDLKFMRPSENPSKIEVVNVTYSCPLGDRMAFAKIYRPPGGIPFLSTWDFEPLESDCCWNEPHLGGRFNAPYLKAERFKRIADSRHPGFYERVLKKFENSVCQMRVDPHGK